MPSSLIRRPHPSRSRDSELVVDEVEDLVVGRGTDPVGDALLCSAVCGRFAQQPQELLQSGLEPGRGRRRRPARSCTAASSRSSSPITDSAAGGPGGDEFAPQVRGQRGRGRVVEDQGRGQPQAGGGAEPVAQLDRGQRVEAEVLEGPVGARRRRRRRGRARRRPGRGPGRAGRPVAPPRPGPSRSASEPRRASAARGAVGGAGDLAGPAPGPGRAAGAAGPVGRGGCAQGARRRGRPAPGGRVGDGGGRVEQRQALARRTAGSGPAAAMPGEVGRVQVAGHAAGLGPQAPGERGRGQALRAAVLRRARRGRRWRRRSWPGRRLPRVPASEENSTNADRSRSRGQLVQVPGGVDLRAQHGVDALRGEATEQTRRRGRRRRARRR